MDVLEAISSMRAVRHFTDDTVSDKEIGLMIEAATKAPSGGGSEPWHFIAVRSLVLKKRLGKVFADTWDRMMVSSYLSSVPMDRRWIYREATEMVHGTDKAPLIIIACIDTSIASKNEKVKCASIYPAVQNLMLAAWSMGIGSCLTTHGCIPSRGESEVKKILGLPDHVEVSAVIFLGRPRKPLSLPRRRPVSQVLHEDRW